MKQKTLTVGSLKPGAKQLNHTGKLRKQAKASTGQQIQQQAQRREAPKSIRVEQKGTAFTIRPIGGITLLDNAIQQSQPITYKCRKGKCGKCKVKMLQGTSMLCPLSEAERQKLGDDSDSYRLACQAKITNDK